MDGPSTTKQYAIVACIFSESELWVHLQLLEMVFGKDGCHSSSVLIPRLFRCTCVLNMSPVLLTFNLLSKKK